MLAMLWGNNKAAFGSDTLLESDGAVQKQGFQLLANAVSLYKWICITAEQIVFNKNYLSSSKDSGKFTNGILNKLFLQQFVFYQQYYWIYYCKREFYEKNVLKQF